MWPKVNVRTAGPAAAILVLSGSATATSIVAQVLPIETAPHLRRNSAPLPVGISAPLRPESADISSNCRPQAEKSRCFAARASLRRSRKVLQKSVVVANFGLPQRIALGGSACLHDLRAVLSVYPITQGPLFGWGTAGCLFEEAAVRCCTKFCIVGGRPVNKGLGLLQMSGAKWSPQRAPHRPGTAFGAVAKLCRRS